MSKIEINEDTEHNMFGIYKNTFLALTIMTIVEVAASYLPDGAYVTVILLLLAVAKAALVGAVFMHIKYDKTPWLLTLSVFVVPLAAGSILIFNVWKDWRGVAGA